MHSSTSLPPLGPAGSMRRSTQLSSNNNNNNNNNPHTLQQQRPARAHQLYLQRPGSVEGDIHMLSNLRRRMQITHELFDHILQDEHKQRYQLYEEFEMRWKSILSMWASGGAQVRYREELREKVKVQSALTEKVHALFEVSMMEEKTQKAKKKENELAKKRNKAQRVRDARPSDLRPRRSSRVAGGAGDIPSAFIVSSTSSTPVPVVAGEEDEHNDHHRPYHNSDDGNNVWEQQRQSKTNPTTNFLSQPTWSPEMEERYHHTQARRAEDHHRRYKCDITKKISVAIHATSVREEETALRRERIVQRAIGLHDNRRRVEDVRRAQSLTPTAFLQLPPLREVFADDVLAFDAPTLMSRHYHSTYRPSGGGVGGDSGMLLSSSSAMRDRRSREPTISDRSVDVGIGTD
ncbi:Hypothetical protein, putative [Bodo saltans]|uniref:Uncharacterized protein n=1 Tax=Bodo saltans TaxID=75058 RepID=A0A0S4JDN9_BODSA|nr:Hypothetical protein, putative [Bodo saltans]|eukprot:CUG88402.1 Hypothetical protein, putative [Bodo saltans]